MALPDPGGSSSLRSIAAWSGAVALYLAGFGPLLASGLADLDPADELRVLRWSVAALGILGASAWLLLMRTRQEMAVVEDLLADVRFGPGTKRDRDAVDILVKALRVEDPGVRETALRTLRKITSRDLGPDPGPWETWWAGARESFSRSGGKGGR